MKRSSRMVREVYPEIEPENEGNQAQVCIVGDVVYGMDEPVPAEQPCLKCRCQPPGVQCETIQCSKKPGCKAIHRPNMCCPDYQCECEYNGRTYANGEKLETSPGGECKVCYCRGGEVQCAEVSCYIRNDCEGKTVPGTCCPKYDHCPPIELISDREASPSPTFTTELSVPNTSKDAIETWLLTTSPQNSTDNIIQALNDIENENKINDANLKELDENANKIVKLSEVEDLQKVEAFHNKITIQEIIPEIKEIPITAPPKVEEPHGQLIIEEAKPDSDDTSNDLVVTDSEPDSSEISEVIQHPPPVLRIGDKLLFLKKDQFVHEDDVSTPQPVITIIGAEGLQRGFEESGEIHEVKIDAGLNVTILNTTENPDKGIEPENSSNSVETSESSHILSLIKRKNQSTTTTESSMSESGTESTVHGKDADGNLQSSSATTEKDLGQSLTSKISTTEQVLKEPIVVVETTSEITNSTSEAITIASTVTFQNTTDLEITNDSGNSTSTTNLPSSTEINLNNYEMPVDQNPAYPPISEILDQNQDDTSHRFENENINTETSPSTQDSTTNSGPIEMKILPAVLDIRNNKTIPENTTHNEWLKNEKSLSTDSLINIKAVLPTSLLNEHAPTDYEETTETTTEDISESTKGADGTTETIAIQENTGEEETEKATTLVNSTERSIEILELTTEYKRSPESLEKSEESGEIVTPKSDTHASILSNENASVEGLKEETSEVGDMLLTPKVASETNKAESIEEDIDSLKHDVELIDNINKDSIKKINGTDNINDVEIINNEKLEKLQKQNRLDDELASPKSNIQKSLLTNNPRQVGKRENSPDDEADEVFRQLNYELTAETTDRIQSREEEEKEAEMIFRELLDESSTPASKQQPESRNRESEAIKRVTDALAKLTLRGRQPDSSILGILTNFFSSQYRSYDSK